MLKKTFTNVYRFANYLPQMIPNIQCNIIIDAKILPNIALSLLYMNHMPYKAMMGQYLVSCKFMASQSWMCVIGEFLQCQSPMMNRPVACKRKYFD